MAFKKALTLQGDVEVINAYHRIVHFDADAIGRVLKVEIAVYKDEATRQADEGNYLHGHSVFVTIPNDPSVPSTDFNDFFVTPRPAQSIQASIYAAMYAYIKSKEIYYSDAVDV
ncbi:hypothetical protein KAR91_69545 [Candidatus Pacearchaeota archaeon]|nr:hypothetical protein [Candidatus Pacearchaeota archaeon]